MGLRPVSLETLAEIIFKEARQIHCDQGPGPTPLLTSATSSRWGRGFPETKAEVIAPHPVPMGLP